MKSLINFLKQKKYSVILKTVKYLFIEGVIIESNNSSLRIKDIDGLIHFIPFDIIRGIGLSPSIIPPGPCLFTKLPLKFKPYCWTCSSNSLIFDLLYLKNTLPPSTSISLYFSEFDSFSLSLKDIYQINNEFIFVCANYEQYPDIYIPTALVNKKLLSISIASTDMP